MTESDQIYQHAIEAVGAKRIARALGLSLGHVYRFARPTMEEDPSGTGCRSDLDRLEELVDLLAARPEGRPVLVEIRQHVRAMLDRALGAWRCEALTPEGLVALEAAALREVGEALTACAWEGLDRSAARKEVREAIAALEALDTSLAQPADEESEQAPTRERSLRRAG